MQCQPFQSAADPSFWSEFSKRKLELFKLNDSLVEIDGIYGVSRVPGQSQNLRLSAESFDTEREEDQPTRYAQRSYGKLKNTNTKEEFKELDKKGLLNEIGAEILSNIQSGAVEENPALLNSFLLISYADLKYHKFLHWFCFPAAADGRIVEQSVQPISSFGLSVELREFLFDPGCCLPPFFGVINSSKITTLDELLSLREEESAKLTCFAMVDPGSLPDKAGWPLLNFALWILNRYYTHSESGSFDVLCVRQGEDASIALKLKFSKKSDEPSQAGPVWIGWEPFRDKMTPRITDLSPHLDPEKLAQSACDLNVKLMRWRALPELDTERINNTSCLLVGSGTLGCAVARCLLGWGFRKITMLDYGRVSYSNPVRQSLFEFKDCLDGGRPKAQAAAEALSRILPGVTVKGVNLSIPMPGHFVTSEKVVEDTKRDVELLEQLIKDHDVVMLLTDTRESRWLPTLLGAKYDKLVLNSALGFDSFLVMRHGSGPHSGQRSEERLGCYFCNDVVAPQNSMKDRTLDQQCTVTRPGLAPIAGALLVEILVSILHHSQGNCAGITEEAVEKDGLAKLGSIPHQIRGMLPTFQMSNISGQSFPQCTACSSCVVDRYAEDGFGFLMRVFNEPQYLEDLTGLSELRNSAALASLLEDDFDGFDDDEDGLQ